MQPTIPQYDPNEDVTLVGNKGTVKVVKRKDLGQYDLPPDYISQADTYAKSVKDGVADIGSIPESYRAGALQTLNRQGYTPQSKGEFERKQKADEAKKEVVDRAKAVLDVIDQGKTGKLKGDKYKDTLNAAVSNYVSGKAFGEGGKNHGN